MLELADISMATADVPKHAIFLKNYETYSRLQMNCYINRLVSIAKRFRSFYTLQKLLELQGLYISIHFMVIQNYFGRAPETKAEWSTCSLQWKPLNRASVYRADCLFEQFRLNKTIPSFSS